MNFDSDITMQVVARDKAVILLFSRINSDDGKPTAALTDNMRMDPDTALLAAQCITDMAFEADESIKPVGSTLKASLIEKHRSVLIPRIATVMNSVRENKNVSNDQLAKQLMDIVCHEVFT